MSASTTIRTMDDIARLAGVSKSTVSRALSDSPLIAVETKERIRAIAREHRFQLNAPARRLSLKRSRAVALVLYGKDDTFFSPDVFMLEIMGGMSAGLRALDYDLLVTHVDPSDTDWPRRYVDSGRADGFVLLFGSCNARQRRLLADMRAPFIIWGAAPADRRYCSVFGDSVTGGRLATGHLLETGRRRIAFLGGPEASPEVQDRLRGYEEALRAAGHELDPALVAYADWMEPETAGPALRQLLERAPDVDGVFANSDMMAMAAMDAARTAGRRVPRDVAVVGYDDIAVARHATPPLTTIRQNGPLAGRLLAQNLLQHLETGAVTNVTIPAELVVRAST